MSRAQLHSYADRFLEIVNNPTADLEELSELLAPDVQTPLTYPNTPSGFNGIKGLIRKLHGSLTSFALTVTSEVVDEKESRVVFFVKSAGVQTGHVFLVERAYCREWHGVPGTGRKFDHYGFIMMKVSNCVNGVDSRLI